MGKMKKILTVLLAAFVLTAAVAVPAATTTEAAVSKITVAKAVRIGVGQEKSNFINIDFPKAYTIKNLKAYKGKKKTSDLIFKLTYLYDYTNKEDSSDSNYHRDIFLFAKKAGTYNLKFDVYDGSKKITSKTVKVYALSAGNAPIKKITFGGATLADSENPNYYLAQNSYTTLKKGKLKVSVNKGIKIKSIKAESIGKNGKTKSKTIKNGKSVTLNKIGELYSNNYSSEFDKTKSYNKNYWASTRIIITYFDKYSANPKEENVYAFTLYKKATSWAKVTY